MIFADNQVKDNDQDEAHILAIILDSPSSGRSIMIRPFRNLAPIQGDEIITINLGANDGYLMDGTMQKFYTHSIPKNKAPTESQLVPLSKRRRLVVVLRAGRQEIYKKDSGASCSTDPLPPYKYVFGNDFYKLVEGFNYNRQELFMNGFHGRFQGGISGNLRVGCDAIVVSGKREDQRGYDQYTFLTYFAESRKGANALAKSFEKNLPIRVFRSSVYKNPFRAIVRVGENDGKTKYRYDGLYQVGLMEPPKEEGGAFKFVLHRCNDLNGIRNHDMYLKIVRERKTQHLAIGTFPCIFPFQLPCLLNNPTR